MQTTRNNIIQPKKFIDRLADLIGECYNGLDPADVRLTGDYAVGFQIPKNQNPLGASMLVVDNVHGTYGVRFAVWDEENRKYEKRFELQNISIEECADYVRKAYGYRQPNQIK